MAAKFTLSSDSDSDPSEEVEEGENSQSSTEREQQVFPRHALTLPELRMAGKKTGKILWQWHSVFARLYLERYLYKNLKK